MENLALTVGIRHHLPVQVEKVELHHLVLLSPGETEAFLAHPWQDLSTLKRVFLDKLDSELEEMADDHWARKAVMLILHYTRGGMRPKARLWPSGLCLLLPFLPGLQGSKSDLKNIWRLLRQVPEIGVALVLSRAAADAGLPTVAEHYRLTVMALLLRARFQVALTLPQQGMVAFLERGLRVQAGVRTSSLH